MLQDLDKTQNKTVCKMTHDFIINTENVNEYKYRILTDGIDYTQYMRNPVVLFMHEREFEKKEDGKGSAVIGRCLKIYKKDTDLVATIEFDEKDEFAQKIAGKVERGYIRMASMYADVKATSSDTELVLPGQVYETVTACKLVEISIVDIGGNDDAIKLSKDGKPVQLQKVKLENDRNMSHLKTIALALALSADSTEDTVLKEVQGLKLAKETAEKEASDLKVKLKGIQTAEATALVEKAVSLGLIPEALKQTQINAFESDFDGQKVTLSKLISDKEAEGDQAATHQTVKEVVLGGKGSGNGAGTQEETFDYLQKFDTVKLRKIKEENPEQYAKLAKDYANGVRHVEKK